MESLRFSIEECVAFQPDEVIGQLASIELTPIVSVDEFEDYVVLRGTLQLCGEYEVGECVECEELPQRYIQTVEQHGDSYFFEHHFPVDITIPKNRIAEISDVCINVDAFDYEFVNGVQLQLVADLFINGVQEGQSVITPKDLTREDLEELFSPFTYTEFQQEREVVEEFENIQELQLIEEFELSTAVEFPIAKEERVEVVQEVITEVEQEVVQKVTSEVQQEVVQKVTSQVQREVVQEIKEAPVQIQSSKNSPSYLTDLFSAKDTEQFSKIKLCIVQQDQPLRQIAERYKVSVQQLLHLNNLDYEAEVEDGQLLYIPLKK